jgi:simple sugar transport system substrate-binding protein
MAMKKLFVTIIALTALFAGCSTKKSKNPMIAVFIPGIIADSPTYEKLANGVLSGVTNYHADKTDDKKALLSIMEVGTNQAEWAQKLTALAAEQKYDVIISSNPSLPDLVEPIIAQFPKQKFILLDATREGNDNIYTVCYDQSQQGFLAGYVGGLMSKTGRLALIAAQEYPVMNEIIYPSFVKGAVAARSDASVDFRVVGNWYDATKGAEIADAVAKKGVDVILPICGGASQGVITSAVNNGIYVTWFDDNGFAKAPGTIISSSVMEQKKMSYNVTIEFLEDKTSWGTADMVGIKEGFVDFIQDDPNYIKTVPEDIRKKMADLLADIRAGKVEIK